MKVKRMGITEILRRIWELSTKDGGSPAARLRFARLTLARLGLNDGAKLWVSFKLNLCRVQKIEEIN